MGCAGGVSGLALNLEEDSIGAVLLNLIYPDYAARFLFWKGVSSIALLVAGLAGTRWNSWWHAPTERALRWTR